MGKKKNGWLSAVFSKKAHWSIKTIRTTAASVALVCLIPFGSRYLPGEPLNKSDEDLAQTLFQSSINYKDIKIHNSAAASFIMGALGAEGLTYGNTILLHRDINSLRLNENAFYADYVMAHELAHVWQGQLCGNLHFRAGFEKATSAINGKGLYGHYEYDLTSGKDLSEYGIEQQASIIADYYAISKGEQPLFLIHAGTAQSAPIEYKPLYDKTLALFLKNPSYLKSQCK